MDAFQLIKAAARAMLNTRKRAITIQGTVVGLGMVGVFACLGHSFPVKDGLICGSSAAIARAGLDRRVTRSESTVLHYLHIIMANDYTRWYFCQSRRVRSAIDVGRAV
jgi:hypothetical protein